MLDENFPEPAIRKLRSEGFDVLAIAENHSGISDIEVLSIARNDERWLASFDLDFGELLFAKRFPAPPAVILLRVRQYRPEEPALWIAEWMRNQSIYLGTFTVFNGETMRNRKLV